MRDLSARVEARLEAAEARNDEPARGVREATATMGRAAQDFVEVVVAMAERLEAQLQVVTTGLTSSVGELVEGSERRLGTHVDDAVLALAEVVLRRRRPGAASPAPQAGAHDEAAPGGDGLVDRAGPT